MMIRGHYSQKNDPRPLPPKKRSIHRRDEAAMQVVSRPWCERPPPRYHAADSSRELVLWAPMPPSSWIRFPRFYSNVMPPRGPLELWLQHTDCSAPATRAEIKAVPTGKIFMTRGWGEIARVCRVRAPSRSTLSTMTSPCSS